MIHTHQSTPLAAIPRRSAWTVLLACLLLLVASATASATTGVVSVLGSPQAGGSEAQFNGPSGIAVNQTTGDAYVVDSGNNRVQEFSEEGAFVRAWGFGVTASGPDAKSPVDEVKSVVVSATTVTSFILDFGGFKLFGPTLLGGEETASIPVGAPAAAVEAALQALPSIGGKGGVVTVTGAGEESSPYLVTFGGSLGGIEQTLGTAFGTNEGVTVTVATVTPGSSPFEECVAANGDTCRAGVASSEAGGMNDPQGVAVDQGTGNVYVTDQGNHRVDVFSSTGAFEGAWGWGVSDGAAAFEFCTAPSSPGECRAGQAGSEAGELGEQVGYPAVDPVSGDVYVADPSNSRVDEFSVTTSSGTVTGAESAGSIGGATPSTFTTAEGSVVEQSTGDILVIDAGARIVSRWHSDGTPADFSALGTNVIDGAPGADGKSCDEEPSSCDKTPQESILGNGTSPREVEVAVDDSGTVTNGDIYITDSSEHLIDVFASDGHYLGQLTESSEGGFGEVCGVAVDSNGAVYVGDYSGTIHKFVPNANPPVTIDNTANFTASQPCALAAGAGPTAGYLFVTSYGSGAISKLDSANGQEQYVVSPEGNTTVTVDPANGHVYAAAGGEVKEFDASGATDAVKVSSISPGSTVQGVAVDAASDDVYVAREGNTTVEVFGPSPAHSLLGAIGSPGNASQFEYRYPTSIAADGHGNVYAVDANSVEKFDAAGEPVADFATAQLPGEPAPAAVAVNPGNDHVLAVQPCDPTICPGASATAERVFEFDTSGRLLETYELDPGVSETKTEVGLAAASSSGDIYLSSASYGADGPQHVFTLNTIVAPAAAVEAAGGVSAAGAVLHGTVTPNESVGNQLATEYEFEYSLDGQHWTPVSAAAAGKVAASTSPVAVEQTVTGLESDTTYQVRLTATKEFAAGSATSAITEFTTESAPPTVSALTASDVESGGALLEAQVNPEGEDTTYRVEYGASTSYGTVVAEGDAGSSVGGSTVGAHPAGLSPDTVYYYRVLASNGRGTVEVAGTFTTKPAVLAVAVTGSASAVAQNTAVISGTLSTAGQTTTYGFEIGTSAGSYGPPTGLGAVGAGGVETPVSLSLSGLVPGTTYHYRITASNVNGAVYGADQTFTTATFPNAFVVPPAPLPFVAVPSIAFPVEAITLTKSRTKTLTKAQKLAKALKECKSKPNGKRESCEKVARRKFGPAEKKAKKTKDKPK